MHAFYVVQYFLYKKPAHSTNQSASLNNTTLLYVTDTLL